MREWGELATQWPERVIVLSSVTSGIFGEVTRTYLDAFSELGCRVQLDEYFKGGDRDSDLVVGWGPTDMSGSLMPAVARKAFFSLGRQRPLFAWWLTEPLPDSRIPRFALDFAMRTLRELDMRVYEGAPDGGTLDLERLPRIWGREPRRLRILEELVWFKQRGAFDVIATSSPWRRSYLGRFGISPTIISSLGYHPIYGADLGLVRDIPVAFLGSLSRRRRRTLAQLKGELSRRRIKLSMLLGAYGAERTRFLNRTKILLNVVRSPEDALGLRFLIASANKTLIVTEPMKDFGAFVPGQHLVAVPVEKIVDTIEYYLSHEEERRRITEQAFYFVTHDLSMPQMCNRLLEAGRQAFLQQTGTP